MSIKNKQFDLFGKTYRTKQFSAEAGLMVMESEFAIPTEILAHTEILSNKEWILLDNRQSINELVSDCLNFVPPVNVLKILMSIVNDFNFIFLEDWKGVSIPRRFTQEGKSVDSKHSPALIAQLVQGNTASMRELQEYYSLEDAFRMFDIKVAAAVNEAIANEAAAKGK